MSKTCRTCPKCGSGKPKAQRDPVKQALCVIFCQVRKEFCQGKHKGKQQSAVAEDRARKSRNLKRAANGKYKGGARPSVNQPRLVPYKGAPKAWGRSPLKPDALKRHLKPLRDKLLKQAGTRLGKLAARKAATGWMKLVPVLNVLSTAYDVYDIASTGYDIYKTIDKALDAYKGDVFSVRPDVAIEGADGKLKDIYDFKFEKDRWRKGQKELYNKALKDSGSNAKAKEISQKTCQCDGPAKPPAPST